MKRKIVIKPPKETLCLKEYNRVLEEFKIAWRSMIKDKNMSNGKNCVKENRPC